MKREREKKKKLVVEEEMSCIANLLKWISCLAASGTLVLGPTKHGGNFARGPILLRGISKPYIRNTDFEYILKGQTPTK